MQDLLVNLLGETGATVARYLIAIAVVVLLLVVLRRALGRYMNTPGLRHRPRQPRLAVMDVTAVDARRRLVLVRRDNVEHLILIGGPTDVVVEQTIIKGVPVGSLGGRMPGRPAAAPPSPAPVAPVPVPEPALRADADAPALEREPDPVAEERVEPVAAAPAPAPEPVVAPVVEVGPYVPPVPSRPLASAEPIEPIVALKPTAPPAPAPAAPAEPAGGRSYDDLARRLDEALRIDLPDVRTEPAPAPYVRPIRGPAARNTDPVLEPEKRPADRWPEPKVEATPPEPAPVDVPPAAPPAEAAAVAPPEREPDPAPETPPENVIELPAPKLSGGTGRFASAWFRPRKADGEKPPVAPKSEAPTPPPVDPVPQQPAAEPAEPARKPFADDLARILEEEPLAEMAPPQRTEPKIEPPRPPVAAPEPAAGRKAPPPKDEGLASLEDEMARLLDELAGDGKSDRR